MLMPGDPKCWWDNHLPWNQLVWKNPLMEPEASVKRERVSEVSQREGKNSPLPFHCLINKLHISRSLKKPAVSLMWWSGFLTPLVRTIMRCRKGRPGAITLHEKFRVPIRDWSSCRVVDRLDRNSQRAVLIRSTLFTGSLASILWVSRMIPMNWGTLREPSVLAAEMGMFRVLKDKIMLDRLARQTESRGTVGAGSSIIRKSSKIWQTKDRYHAVVLQYPLYGIRELVKNKRGWTEPKWEHFIKIVNPFQNMLKSSQSSEPDPWIAEMALAIVMY